MDKNFSWRRFLLRRLNILAVLSLAACIAGQLGGLHWFAGLFGHFVPHYAAVFLLAALFCPGRRRWLWAVCAAGAALWLMQPFVLERPSETRRSLIWYNVHLDNPQAAAETAALLAAAPDMLALAEIDTADGGWAQLRRRYPYGCERESDSPFALALWSRRPPDACEVRFSGDYPYIRALVGDTAVYALHPPPPVGGALARDRDAYLAETARLMAAEDRVLAVGDLNDSPFSPTFRRFAAAAGLAPQMRFYTPTWRPFFLQIDHVLTRGTAAAVHPMPWRHSDHRALSVVW